MPALERNAIPTIGAAFYREAGEVMFQFVIDTGNIVGPRPATKADSEKHPEAWHAFVTGEEAEPAVEIAPGPREPEAAAAPITHVEPKNMDGFEGRLQPAPAKQKRAYKRRAK